MVEQSLVQIEHVERVILVLRGQKVLLDSDLAALYAVPVKALNRAGKRSPGLSAAIAGSPSAVSGICLLRMWLGWLACARSRSW